MDAKVNGNMLTVSVPFDVDGSDCQPSKDGTVKSKKHASSGGFIPTTVKTKDGKPVKVNLVAISSK